MADISIVASEVANAPQDYTLPGSQEILLKAVGCNIDGTGAAGTFLPSLQCLDPSGHVMWTAVNRSLPVAAGGSALVSWFPGGGIDQAAITSSSSGGVAPSGAAGGDLSSNYPDPTVIALEETSGPTRLALGAIPDGDFLQRSGSTVIGTASSASIAVTDGTTTETGVSTIDFTSGAVVSSGGAGIADVAITAASLGFSGARIYSSVNQSIPDTTDTTQTFDTVQFDVGGYANLGAHNTRLTAPVTGYYMMGACVAFPNGHYYTQLYVFINGVRATAVATIVTNAPTAGTNPDLAMGGLYKLTAGDYIETGVVQESGAAANSLSAPPTVPSMWITLIGV